MQLSRLRRGEIVAVLSAVVLAVLVFAVPWFSSADQQGGHTSANAWSSLPTLRWLLLITAAGGLLLGYLQASRSAPALPVSMDVVVVTVSAVTTVALLVRLLTGDGSPQAGAFLGLAACAGVTVGAFMALRQEGGWEPGPDHPVETIAVDPPGAPDRL